MIEKLLIVKQILLVRTLGNLWRTVWRICTLMLECKQLIALVQFYQLHVQLDHSFFHTKKTCLGTSDANISQTCDFDFFSSVFVFVFFQSDVSLNGFKKHKAHESAPPPLTTQELELEMVKQQEVRDLMSWNFVLNAIGHVLNQHGT